MTVERMGARIVVAALAAVVGLASLSVADPPGSDAAGKSASAPAAKNKEGTTAPADLYDVPTDGDVEQLLAFIRRIREHQPNDFMEIGAHRAKMFAAVMTAAERIQEIATEMDKSLPGYREAMDHLLWGRVQAAQRITRKEREALFDDIRDALAASPQPSQELVNAACFVPALFEYAQPERAVRAYTELGALLAKNADASIARRGAGLEGAARRLTLVGNPLEIHGTMMDGSTFDWGSYRGRVVLVDFWATWCGPCLRELPNVMKNYEAYHDKGFDVVAISLDDDRAKLEKFLEENPKPWVNLHDGGGMENNLANYYGVTAIPTMFLVDKEGKVVSTAAMGPILGLQLKRLLGPADTEPANKNVAPETDKAKAPP